MEQLGVVSMVRGCAIIGGRSEGGGEPAKQENTEGDDKPHAADVHVDGAVGAHGADDDAEAAGADADAGACADADADDAHGATAWLIS